MTTWAGGDVLTAAWMNSVEDVLSASSYDDKRFTVTPNQTHDLNGAGAAGSQIAGNFIMPAATAISVATAKFNYTFGLFPTASVTGTGAYRGFSWEATITSSGVASEANGIVASGTISGDGILKSVYGRATAAAGFTGVLNGGTFGVTSNATTGTASVVGLDAQGTTVSHGIYFSSGTPGTDVGWGMLVAATVLITNACYAYVQRTGSTADVLRYVEPTGVTTMFSVDYLGNLNFKASGTSLTTGQRITGDFTNATLAKRVLFQTATANSTTTVGVIPSGSGTTSAIVAYGLADPDNSSKVQINALSASTCTINVTKAGTGTQNGLGIQIGSSTAFLISAVKDIFIGQTGAAAGDTAGHHFIQAVAGAPTGVPGGVTAGYVAIRYDSTNDFLYVYNGGWKKSTAYA